MKFLLNSAVLTAMAASTLGIIVSDAFGQEDEPVQTQIEMAVIDSDDGTGPMVFSSVNGASIQFAPGGMLGGDFAMPAPDPFSMISNPSVQKDLELVGDQLEKIQKLQKEHSQKMRDQLGIGQGGSLNLQDIEAFKKSVEEMKSQQQAELKKLLLPQQIDRLKQIAFQTHMKQAGAANALANKKIKEALGLTDEKIKELKEKSKELNKKLAEDIEELKAKMKEELLGELTSEQREKIKSLTGEKYQPQKEDWQERFRSIRSRGPRRMNRDN